MSLHTICESDECTFISKSNEELGNHTESNHSMKTNQMVTVNAASIKCFLCKERFETMLELEWHTETEHEETSCTSCTFVTYKLEELERHIVSSHSFPCVICKEVFNTSNSLNIHKSDTHKDEEAGCNQFDLPQRSSTPVEPYVCERCDNTYIDVCAYNKHTCSSAQEGSLHNCDQCEFKSNNVKDLVAHNLEVHRQ